MSGAAALVYESLWMRQFALVFGNTTYSVTVTLAALATFCRRFPYASLWPVPPSTGSQDGWPTPVRDILLLGSLRPLPLDSRRVKAAWSLPGIREDLSAVGIRDELDLLAAWTADREDLLALAGQAPENTDERPLLELNAPRGLYSASNSREQRLCTGRWPRCGAIGCHRWKTIRHWARPAPLAPPQLPSTSALRICMRPGCRRLGRAGWQRPLRA